MEKQNFVSISSISTGFIEIPGQISTNIYVQGCSIGCKDCQNADLKTKIGGKNVTTDELKNILEHKIMSTWVCWLGGEPTDQPNGLIACNKVIKSLNDYKICLYTGRQFEEIQHLLDDVDLLIDGPWRGIPITEKGSNQKTYIKENDTWECVDFNNLKEILC